MLANVGAWCGHMGSPTANNMATASLSGPDETATAAENARYRRKCRHRWALAIVLASDSVSSVRAFSERETQPGPVDPAPEQRQNHSR